MERLRNEKKEDRYILNALLVIYSHTLKQFLKKQNMIMYEKELPRKTKQTWREAEKKCEKERQKERKRGQKDRFLENVT